VPVYLTLTFLWLSTQKAVLIVEESLDERGLECNMLGYVLGAKYEADMSWWILI
jgi:hypothetical protein